MRGFDRELSRTARVEPTSGGVLKQYVGASRASATIITLAIGRLWQMGLFQRPARELLGKSQNTMLPNRW
jgi:hypothetical protein